MVRQWQDFFYKKNYVATPIYSPDFVKLGEAYGIPAWTIDKPSRRGRRRWPRRWRTDGPALLNFQVAQEENVFPMIPAGQTIKEMIESEEGQIDDAYDAQTAPYPGGAWCRTIPACSTGWPACSAAACSISRA